MAHDAVAILRAEVGRNPYDQGLTQLVGALSTRSEEFRRLWASHDVRLHRTGSKVFHHPAVGKLELDHVALLLPADTGLQMNVDTATPNTPSGGWAPAARLVGRHHLAGAEPRPTENVHTRETR